MKQGTKHSSALIRSLLSLTAGILTFCLLLFLAAWLTVKGTIPFGGLRAEVLLSLFLGSMVTGACIPGGGKRFQYGLMFGALLAVLVFLCKALLPQAEGFEVRTWCSMGACLCGAVSGSCIFHKKQQRRTTNKKRKHRR